MSQLDLSLYLNHYFVLLLLFFLLIILISLRFYNFFLVLNIRNNFISNSSESINNNFKQFSILYNILKL
ncbi:ATP synthase F0 subunit 8 (mitochondrion) [Hydra vulgaris]|uniref:ATP synthase F0 subunit 8 n=1 Tax=Hydra vulgaris TaxID=6087 RepID=B4F7M2_HYDVU|nr:ATP synthase F0 subunit 8 [Hydra vulgaris]ADI99793.1 ATP synthase F0 subunit 8 [Hydra vulgaris]BAR90844.1 ATP synthase F0 subunit 8 [Hydra vulgaris]BAR90850.1 ATP synthase F0 subunit 8 [Hydra vulgaris]BAR90855.1 ATP synthase F0 subunit 8 [Hydra vulgaris]BAR90860.1 ATP synthase F0 subunit 8 [Hydra vulgaris]